MEVMKASSLIAVIIVLFLGSTAIQTVVEETEKYVPAPKSLSSVFIKRDILNIFKRGYLTRITFFVRNVA